MLMDFCKGCAGQESKSEQKESAVAHAAFNEAGRKYQPTRNNHPHQAPAKEADYSGEKQHGAGLGRGIPQPTIGKHKTIARDHFAHLDIQRLRKHWTSEYKSMKLAILAAGVDALR